MDSITLWKPEYSVGVDEIDNQHRYLLELCRALHQIKDLPENRLSLKQVLEGMFDYVDLHFNYEEKQYAQHPEFKKHQQLHRDFICKTDAFMESFEQGDLDLPTVSDYLTDWITNHIIKVDIRFFKEIAALQPASSAPSENERRGMSRKQYERPIIFRTEQTIQQHTMDIRNISRSGAYVELPELPPVGTRCSIEIDMDRDKKNAVLLLDGIVSRQDEKGVGIQFNELEPEAEILLEFLLL